jgi:hypothetical protein
MAVLEALRYIFWSDPRGYRGWSGQRGHYGLGASSPTSRGAVDQELLARNEYLAAENRILKAQLQGRLKLSEAERALLGEIGHRLGRKALAEVKIQGVSVLRSGSRQGHAPACPLLAPTYGASDRKRSPYRIRRTGPASLGRLKLPNLLLRRSGRCLMDEAPRRWSILRSACTRSRGSGTRPRVWDH